AQPRQVAVDRIDRAWPKAKAGKVVGCYPAPVGGKRPVPIQHLGFHVEIDLFGGVVDLSPNDPKDPWAGGQPPFQMISDHCGRPDPHGRSGRDPGRRPPPIATHQQYRGLLRVTQQTMEVLAPSHPATLSGDDRLQSVGTSGTSPTHGYGAP